MRRYIYPALAILVTVGFYYWEKHLDKKKCNEFTEETRSLSTTTFDFLPKNMVADQIVNHAYYSLSYNEKHEQANWVAYELKREHTAYNDFKRPYFEQDPLVRTNSADWRNYKKSGYDRGHLCPAADRRFLKKAHDETFLTSNISPQLHNFNAGIWNDLEKKVRYWLNKEKQFFIVTGPVFENTNESIGTESVTVPSHFYKIILKHTKEESNIIAFLIPHNTKSRRIKDFEVSVDEIERITGIDFFPALPNDLEAKLEARTSGSWKL